MDNDIRKCLSQFQGNKVKYIYFENVILHGDYERNVEINH